MSLDWIFTPPTPEMASEIAAYRREFLEAGDSMDGTCGLRKYEDPLKWIEQLKLFENAATVPEPYAPSSQYVCVSGGRILGMVNLRHTLNEGLLRVGGHIGYSVRPCERRKGVAKWMLAEALKICRERGIEKALVTCDEDNEGSRRTILANGGVYENTIFDPEEGRVERYWISLKGENEMKRVFIYYSLSGNGDAVAEKLKEAGVEIRKVESVDPMPKRFFFRIMKGGFQAMRGKKARLAEYDRDVSAFDEVIFGSPIWNGRLTPAANAFLSEVDTAGKKVTFLLTSGGGEAPKTDERLAKEFPGAKVVHLKEPKTHPDEWKKLPF